MGRLPLIAEDLGLLDQEVYNLLRLCGYPGMAVYQFEPERLEALAEASADEANEAVAFNRAVYSGTHDNQTLCGWLKDKTAQKAAEQEKAAAAGEAKIAPVEEKPLEAQVKDILRLLYQTPAPLVIVPLQDIFCFGRRGPVEYSRPGAW